MVAAAAAELVMVLMVLLQPIQLEQQAEHQAVVLEETVEPDLLAMVAAVLRMAVEVAVLVMESAAQLHMAVPVGMVAYE
jgi:hypothetical protein